jgi:hypothetical protein
MNPAETPAAPGGGRPTTGSGPSPWSGDPGVVLLRTVATALVHLGAIDSPGTFTVPYPDVAQRALNSTVLSCLMRKARPPESLPQLVEWAATRPIDSWPVPVPPDAAPPDSFFLDATTRQPTHLCYEWAVDTENTRDAAARVSELHHLRLAAGICRDENAPESYRAFRELLVRHPVLTARELSTLPARANGDLALLTGLLRAIYPPAPISHLHPERRVYTSCARCRTLLHPTTKGGLSCEQRRCRELLTVRTGREFRYDEEGGVHLLIRPLRQWVTEPGLAGYRLAQRLTAAGAEVEPWPGYGAYGMRVRLRDGTVLAVDHKDWTSPALLGRRAVAPPQDPPYDGCVWVVGATRLRDQPGYLAAFEAHRPPSPNAAPDLVTEKELIELARQSPGTAGSSPASGARGGPTKGLF